MSALRPHAWTTHAWPFGLEQTPSGEWARELVQRLPVWSSAVLLSMLTLGTWRVSRPDRGGGASTLTNAQWRRKSLALCRTVEMQARARGHQITKMRFTVNRHHGATHLDV